MKIVSWNANSKFREKYNEILRLDADVYVIQECENPATCKDAEYRAFFANAFWAGQYNYKGLMVLTTRPDVKLERLNWPGDDKRYFIPLRVNDRFTLVGAWACDPYCEELFDWVEVVKNRLDDETVIIGDLNSNVVLDPKHLRKSGKSFGMVLQTLTAFDIEDMWHYHHKEEQGKESTPTFYLYRHLDKPYHLDHCLANKELVSDIKIHARWQWLTLSDHLPVEIEVYIDETDNKPVADFS
ncbi:MAG: hypothetical protein NC402_05795 [Prevotella sp.]|nr:hypothetical protein [Prevotella sp.]MCM1075284.1 hypothetical protein [Ruminococcus sp.]